MKNDFELKPATVDIPDEDLALLTETNDRVEELLNNHYNNMDEAITKMFMEHSSRLEQFMANHRRLPFVKLILRKYEVHTRKTTTSEALITDIKFIRKHKVLQHTRVLTIMSHADGRCLGCGLKHKKGPSV